MFKMIDCIECVFVLVFVPMKNPNCSLSSGYNYRSKLYYYFRQANQIHYLYFPVIMKSFEFSVTKSPNFSKYLKFEIPNKHITGKSL